MTYEFVANGKKLNFDASDNEHAIKRLVATWQKYWRGKIYGGILYQNSSIIASVGFPPAQSQELDIRVEWSASL